MIELDKGGWEPVFAEKPTASMQRYFSQGFIRSWANAMTHNQEEPVLDGDPVTGYQSLTKVTLNSLSVAGRNSDQATVTARVLASQEGGKPKPETITFPMRREEGAWKIDDIVHPGRPSLRTYFRKAYGT